MCAPNLSVPPPKINDFLALAQKPGSQIMTMVYRNHSSISYKMNYPYFSFNKLPRWVFMRTVRCARVKFSCISIFVDFLCHERITHHENFNIYVAEGRTE